MFASSTRRFLISDMTALFTKRNTKDKYFEIDIGREKYPYPFYNWCRVTFGKEGIDWDHYGHRYCIAKESDITLFLLKFSGIL